MLEMSECLEISGLHNGTNGKSCSMCAICGDHIKSGDTVRLVPMAIECQDIEEVAVKCVKVVDGLNGCTVAFVPRNCMEPPKDKNHFDGFAQVVDVHSESKSSHKQPRAKANDGFAKSKSLSECNGRCCNGGSTTVPLSQALGIVEQWFTHYCNKR